MLSCIAVARPVLLSRWLRERANRTFLNACPGVLFCALGVILDDSKMHVFSSPIY